MKKTSKDINHNIEKAKKRKEEVVILNMVSIVRIPAKLN